MFNLYPLCLHPYSLNVELVHSVGTNYNGTDCETLNLITSEYDGADLSLSAIVS